MNTKKRLVVSYKNISEELREELKKSYPSGFQDAMIRVDKGPGDFFYAVDLETDDIHYLIKVASLFIFGLNSECGEELGLLSKNDGCMDF